MVAVKTLNMTSSLAAIWHQPLTLWSEENDYVGLPNLRGCWWCFGHETFSSKMYSKINFRTYSTTFYSCSNVMNDDLSFISTTYRSVQLSSAPKTEENLKWAWGIQKKYRHLWISVENFVEGNNTPSIGWKQKYIYYDHQKILLLNV